jgi:hypothetical protein
MLFSLLICQEQIKEKISDLQKTTDDIEKNWGLKLSDFPFIKDNEEKEIINKISPDNIESIEHEFLRLNFSKELSKNRFLKADPTIIENLSNQFDISQKNFGRYTPQDELILKILFTGAIKNELAEIYPGITIILPLNCLLKEIEKINCSVSVKKTQPPEIKEPISFKVPDSCYFPENIFIKNSSGKYRTFPDWAVWLFHIGEKMAIIHQEKKNIVLGLSLPNRAYAALFFLLGFETWNARQSFKMEKYESEYFNCMLQVEENTPLLIWEKERWKRCFARGTTNIKNQEMFIVNVPGTDNKRHDRFIPKEKIFRIRGAVDPQREVGEHHFGHSMRGFEFLRRYYDKNEEEILNYLLSNEARFALVGSKTALKNEGEGLPVFMKILEKRKEEWLTGSLLDILRINPLILSEFDLSRGTLLNHETVESYNDCLYLIVFDGSLSFLNHYDDLDSDMKVVIFDRNEPRFSDASRIMLDQYYADRENEEDMLLCEKLPESVEVIMFEE